MSILGTKHGIVSRDIAVVSHGERNVSRQLFVCQQLFMHDMTKMVSCCWWHKDGFVYM